MDAKHLHWFTLTLADGRTFKTAAHDSAEVRTGVEDGVLDDLLYDDRFTDKPIIQEIVPVQQENTRLFTVFGVYGDNGYQRFGFVAEAQSPEDAEEIVVNYATNGCYGDPIIACVLEGQHQAVDTDPTFEMAGVDDHCTEP